MTVFYSFPIYDCILMEKMTNLILTFAKGDEVVAVEVKPAAIEELLPPSLKQKKFGGSW